MKSSSIARRLGLGCGAILLLSVIGSLFSALTLNDIGEQIRQIGDSNNRKAELANELRAHISDLAIQTRDVTLLTQMGGIDNGGKAIASIEVAYIATEAALKALLEESASTSEERLVMAEIADTSAKALPLLKKAAQQGADGDNIGAMMTLDAQIRPVETLWRERVQTLIDIQKSLSDDAMASAASTQRRAFLIQGMLVLVSLCAGVLIATVMTRGVTQPLGRAVIVAERIAQGDLTSNIEIRINDETGRLLRAMGRMQDRLRGIVGDIRRSADATSISSAEVASRNQELSHRTETAATSLQEAAASTEELTAAVRQSADSARDANRLALGAVEIAQQGGSMVADVVQTMEGIRMSSRKIADIIGVIDNIAFQTNILALNAAVEAARAGAQGSGFAVVAGEVRNLANRSAEAAREIKALIGASVEQVEGGAALALRTGHTMKEIVASIRQVSDMMGEITVAATEQTGGIAQMGQAMQELDRVTQQNAALVEQSAGAAESMRDQVARLTEIVNTFRLSQDTGHAIYAAESAGVSPPLAIADSSHA